MQKRRVKIIARNARLGQVDLKTRDELKNLKDTQSVTKLIKVRGKKEKRLLMIIPSLPTTKPLSTPLVNNLLDTSTTKVKRKGERGLTRELHQ